jgi:hypothetical protein
MSKVRVMGAAALSFVMLLGSLQYRAVSACRDCIRSGAALEAAAAKARPRTYLRLAPHAEMGKVNLAGIHARGLVIKSADPSRPARFVTLELHDSSGIKLSGLRFDGPMTALHYKLLVMDCRDIEMDGLVFVGDASAYDDDNSVSAAMLRRSSGLRLSRSRFDHFVFGVTLLDTHGVEITDNVLLRMKEDGIRGGGNNTLVIRRNQVANSDTHPRGHPDGIQQWTTNVHTAPHDILIEDNLVRRGSGGAGQGVFVSDEIGLPYANLVIRNNLVVGALFNGISVMGAKSGAVVGNVVLPAPDQESWIRVEHADGLSVTDNRAGRFVIVGKPFQARNQIVAASAEPNAVIAAWLRARGMKLAD